MNHLNRFALLALALVQSGCTISARNHHFELANSSVAVYDRSKNVWCFIPSDSNVVQICSAPYWRKSRFIGLGIPLIPQFNRNSPLAYDIRGERIVELKNLDKSNDMTLSELDGIQLCSHSYPRVCRPVDEISVNASKSALLKLPVGVSHQFLVSTYSVEFKITLKQFSESRWHSVTV